MLREREDQLADMKKTTDERIIQGEQYIQETQEAWQEATTRATEAEKRAIELEKTVSSLEEQLHVDRIHQQLWPPNRSEAPAAQVVESSDTLMEEPTAQVVGDSSHNTSMHNNRCSNNDTDMNEVNSCFLTMYTSSSNNQ